MCGSSRSVRQVSAVTAYVVFGLIWLTTSVVILAGGRAAVVSFFRLPLFAIVLAVALNAMVTAEIAVELFRLGTRWTRHWSDRRHLITVLFVWLVLVSGQLTAAMAVRSSLLNG
jgi:hypothetical protein